MTAGIYSLSLWERAGVRASGGCRSRTAPIHPRLPAPHPSPKGRGSNTDAYAVTFTPFQNATRSRTISASGFGSG